ncbi:MAG: flavodoxin family protein [Actinobacteria bacterium]|nr:flavodoxin family protein [Actinomycetota bacterium]
MSTVDTLPEVSILGVCGSPVREGNVAALLEAALRGLDGIPGVNREVLHLADLRVEDCVHCNWCLRNQEGGRRCSRKDDMEQVYPRVESCDVLLLATPVYFGRLSGHLAAFIDRMRIYVHGTLTAGRLRNKVGGALAVAWFRMAGLEMTLLTVHQFFHAVNMVIASPDLGLQGGAAFSSLEGTGRRAGDDRKLVLRDHLGVASAVSTAQRAVELARLLKAGGEALSGEARP